MHILQSGVPKSGNSWIFAIMRQILKHAGIPELKFITKQPVSVIARQWPDPLRQQSYMDSLDIHGAHWYYQIGAAVRLPIADIESYIEQTTQVWTHSIFNQSDIKNLQKFSHITYIIRDPRAIMASNGHFYLAPQIKWQNPNVHTTPTAVIDHVMYPGARQWVAHIAHALKLSRYLNIHFVFYENLLTNFAAELDRLLVFLAIDLDAKSKAAIVEATSFTTMHQKNPYHVRRGEAGSWVEELQPHQQQEITTITRSMCKLLGYPLQIPRNGYPTPAVPHPLRVATIDHAIRVSRRLTWREWLKQKKETINNYL